MIARGAVAVLAALAAGAGTPAAVRVGDFTIEADGISELTFAATALRFGMKADPNKPPKGVESHAGEKVSWQVHVPRGYRADKSFGLMVWVSPTGGGAVSHGWRGVLARRRLAWIGANRSGNPVWTLRRHALAVQAVDEMLARGYDPDPNRIYVGGMSGGGRIASHVALIHADRFTGGFYIVGCNYFRNIMLGDRKYWPGYWPRPDRKLLARARKEGRYVLMTGPTDFNRDQTIKVADAYKKDGFRYATYMEVPGMGHAYPPAEWFDKGIAALDEPIPQIVAARKPRTRPRPGPSPSPRTRPASRPAEEPAKSRLQLARAYLANGLKDKARQTLAKLVADYPKTPQAAEAKQLLAELAEP